MNAQEMLDSRQLVANQYYDPDISQAREALRTGNPEALRAALGNVLALLDEDREALRTLRGEVETLRKTFSEYKDSLNKAVGALNKLADDFPEVEI